MENGNATRTRVHIRWMIRRDMEEVVGIERMSFSDPWTDEDFVRCLRQRNCIGMVCETYEDEIVGFLIYELHKSRLHLLNLAVDINHRRSGIGTQMIQKLKSKLSNQRRTRMTTAVAERNLAGQLFLRSQGFRWYKTEPNDSLTDNSYLMEHWHAGD